MAVEYHAERDPGLGIPAIDAAARGSSGVAIHPELMLDPVQKDIASIGAHESTPPVTTSVSMTPLKIHVHEPMQVPLACRRVNIGGKFGTGNVFP